MNIEVPWLMPALYWIIGVAFGYVFQSVLARMRQVEAQRTAHMILQDAHRERDAILREAGIEAKHETLKAKELFEQETRARRLEINLLDERTAHRSHKLDEKERLLEERTSKLQSDKNEFQKQESELRQRLSQLSGLSQEQARQDFMRLIEESARTDSANLIRRIQDDTKQNAEREARKIIAIALERYAADQVNDMTTCTIRLPNDDMKARIIGKEGRNIRALEAATGVNILIDDTPEIVVISGFDPMRREVARQAMDRLIQDGRIHPGRIEEIVAKVQTEIEETVRVTGEAAVFELGLQDVDPEIVLMAGRLKFRHSYGQNVLKHSVEMAHLMGSMASEMKLDPAIARRIGLFHDIGKAMTHSIEGSHAMIGADFLRKHGETPLVCNAVAAHHNEVAAESVYAVLAKAGDSITASRPGARAETTEIYIKRLERLEEIARSFKGVERCFAIQAGRELRVIVEPGEVSDADAVLLSRNISKKIEDELDYPGQIKVTVVRETRCVEYAR